MCCETIQILSTNGQKLIFGITKDIELANGKFMNEKKVKLIVVLLSLVHPVLTVVGLDV